MEHADLTPGDRHGLLKVVPSKGLTVILEEPDETGIDRIFQESVTYLRRMCGEEYAAVDAIKMQKGWIPNLPGPFEWNGETANCDWCGELFPIISSASYCGKKCQEAARDKRTRKKLRKRRARIVEACKPRVCGVCSKIYTPVKVNQKFCGISCRNKRNAQNQKEARKA